MIPMDFDTGSWDGEEPIDRENQLLRSWVNENSQAIITSFTAGEAFKCVFKGEHPLREIEDYFRKKGYIVTQGARERMSVYKMVDGTPMSVSIVAPVTPSTSTTVEISVPLAKKAKKNSTYLQEMGMTGLSDFYQRMQVAQQKPLPDFFLEASKYRDIVFKARYEKWKNEDEQQQKIARLNVGQTVEFDFTDVDFMNAVADFLIVERHLNVIIIEEPDAFGNIQYHTLQVSK